MDSANADGHAKIGPSETAQQMSHSQPGTVAQNQAKEADVQALAKLTRALDKKVYILLCVHLLQMLMTVLGVCLFWVLTILCFL